MAQQHVSCCSNASELLCDAQTLEPTGGHRDHKWPPYFGVLYAARHYFPWIFTAIYGNNSLFSVKNFVPPPIESDLGYRFRRRTLNPDTDPNPNSNPDPNPNPRTHPNPNHIFNRNRNKVFERKQKGEKRHRNIGQYSYISRLFCRAGGGGKEGPVSPTAKRGPADDLNVRHAIY